MLSQYIFEHLLGDLAMKEHIAIYCQIRARVQSIVKYWNGLNVLNKTPSCEWLWMFNPIGPQKVSVWRINAAKQELYKSVQFKDCKALGDGLHRLQLYCDGCVSSLAGKHGSEHVKEFCSSGFCVKEGYANCDSYRQGGHNKLYSLLCLILCHLFFCN